MSRIQYIIAFKLRFENICDLVVLSVFGMGVIAHGNFVLELCGVEVLDFLEFEEELKVSHRGVVGGHVEGRGMGFCAFVHLCICANQANRAAAG